MCFVFLYFVFLLCIWKYDEKQTTNGEYGIWYIKVIGFHSHWFQTLQFTYQMNMLKIKENQKKLLNIVIASVWGTNRSAKSKLGDWISSDLNGCTISFSRPSLSTIDTVIYGLTPILLVFLYFVCCSFDFLSNLAWISQRQWFRLKLWQKFKIVEIRVQGVIYLRSCNVFYVKSDKIPVPLISILN